ncbi:MAG: ImmA/IrrE family metallo-endopeptidase [Salinibacterium sp.]|nr:ImmA/IrrE family metallo-endopeptidase [Salinibacterium sp.]
MAQRRGSPEDRLSELHERLSEAVTALTTGADWQRAAVFAAKFRSRSFGNSLLIWVQHQAAFAEGRVPEPEPTFVAGFKQWQQLGRNVLKGQSGHVILAPVTARFAQLPSGGQPRRLARGEQPRPGEVVRSGMVSGKAVHVWDVSQTDGAPIPVHPAPVLLSGHAPAGLWAGLAGRVAAAGYTLTDAESAAAIGGANGVTNFTARTVQVRADMQDAARVKTLAHELGHVLLHDPQEDAGPPHRGIGEVEAETVALMLCATYGLSTEDYSVPYVASWASRVDGVEPADLVRTLGEKVRRTVLDLLPQLPTPAIGDGEPPGLSRDASTGASDRAAVRPRPERETGRTSVAVSL